MVSVPHLPLSILFVGFLLFNQKLDYIKNVIDLKKLQKTLKIAIGLLLCQKILIYLGIVLMIINKNKNLVFGLFYQK